MSGLRQIKITKQITSRDSLSLNKYLAEIGSKKRITAEEEKDLAIRIQAGDESAVAKLVEANLRFVVSVAKQHQNMGEPLDELHVGAFERFLRIEFQEAGIIHQGE